MAELTYEAMTQRQKVAALLIALGPATASEIFLRRTIAAYMVEIRREEDNALIATFQSKVYRKE